MTYGSSYTLTATPASGYRFNYWNFSGKVSGTSNDNPYTGTMKSGDFTATAMFERATVTISSTMPIEAGRVEAPDEYDISTGGLLEFTIYLNPGYMLTGYTVEAISNASTIHTLLSESTNKEIYNGGIGCIVTDLEMQMMPVGTETISITVDAIYYPRLRIGDNEYYLYWIDESGNEKTSNSLCNRCFRHTTWSRMLIETPLEREGISFSKFDFLKKI